MDLTAQSPMKLFEYMAAGRPVIASDLEPLKEILVHMENSLIVEAGDGESLAEAIRQLVDDDLLARRLAETARDEVASYTWSARAEILLRAINGRINLNKNE